MARPEPVSELTIHSDVVEITLDVELRNENLWNTHGDAITSALDEMSPGALVINMGKLQQVTSLGLGRMVYLYKQLMPRKIPFGLIEVPSMIQGVIKMVRLNKIFKCYRDMDHFRQVAMGLLEIPAPPPSKSEDSPEAEEAAATEGEESAPAEEPSES